MLVIVNAPLAGPRLFNPIVVCDACRLQARTACPDFSSQDSTGTSGLRVPFVLGLDH